MATEKPSGRVNAQEVVDRQLAGLGICNWGCVTVGERETK